MSNQINEGAARYTADKQDQSRPEFSGTQGTQSPQQLITEHLDLWTSTVTPKSTSGRGRGSGKSSKIELTGIKKLRELILELAVRGKLVAQNPDDEPASKLLEKIEAEKAQLIKDGKLKKQKPLAQVSDDEQPFELPEGWEWVRLGNLAECQAGFAFKSSQFNDTGDGLPLIRIRDVGQDFSGTFYSGEYRREFLIEKDDYLISMDGIFRVAKSNLDLGLLNQRVSRLNFFSNQAKKDLIVIALQGELSKLQGVKAYTTVDHLSGKQIQNACIPLPPTNEQQRIVAKVDELMALCDQLEQQSEHQLTAHQQLTDTLLATLTDSANAQELNDNWQRLANHFDLLFSGPMGAWAIDRLKDTILQLAVMGKLVPQNPDDEPASKLLERIEEEKALLVKEGKIKKPKKLPPVSDEEKPFELPEGWEWVRFGKLCELITSGSRDWAKYYSESGAKFITMGNLSRGSYVLRLENLRFVSPPKNSEGKRTKLEAGDIVISITGDVGNLGLIPEDFGEAYINQHSCLVRLTATQKNRYVVEFLRTPLAKQQFNEPQRGIKNSFRLSDVDFLMMPLPPLAEQRRIVAKVDELFALCDQLKERLQQASETEQHLTNAIVEQALG